MPEYTPSKPSMSSSRRLSVSVRAFLARAGLAATLAASVYLGLGALSGAAASTVQIAPSQTQMAGVGMRPLCNAGMWGC